MTIGQLIIKYRTQLGMSQLALATQSGVPQATISDIEHGADPHWETMKKLAITLNISVGDLLGTQEVKN